MALMRLAADRIGGGLSGSELEPTHRYLRLLPATEQEFDALLEMKELDFYSMPLDADAPAAPVNGTLYAIVPGSVEKPDGIASETICEYYDPHVTEMGRMNPAWCEELTSCARMLAQDITVYPAKPAVLPWRPSGKISVMDDRAGKYLPVQGARITIVNPSDVLNQATVKTDKNGAFISTKTVPAGTKVN